MKRYVLSFAASLEHKPQNPERTASRPTGGDGSLDFDIQFQEWPSRAAMLKTLEIQGRTVPSRKHWRACKVQNAAP